MKLFIKHENRRNLLKNGKRIIINDFLNNNNYWTTGSWLGKGTFNMWRGKPVCGRKPIHSQGQWCEKTAKHDQNQLKSILHL